MVAVVQPINGGGGSITFTPPAAITVTKLELILSTVVLQLLSPMEPLKNSLVLAAKIDMWKQILAQDLRFTGSNSITLSADTRIYLSERIRINGKAWLMMMSPSTLLELHATFAPILKAGFSVVKVDNPNSTEARVHGLSKAPDFIVGKALRPSNFSSWHLFHSHFGKSHYASPLLVTHGRAVINGEARS